MAGDLKINGTSIVNLITDQVKSKRKTNISDYSNDSNFITKDYKLQSSKTATNATTITNNSGVSAGTYGNSGNASAGQNNKTLTFTVPQFTVNAKGLITSATNRTLKVTTGCSNCSYTTGCSQTSGCNQSSCCNVNCNNCNRCDYCSESP